MKRKDKKFDEIDFEAHREEVKDTVYLLDDDDPEFYNKCFLCGLFELDEELCALEKIDPNFPYYYEQIIALLRNIRDYLDYRCEEKKTITDIHIEVQFNVIIKFFINQLRKQNKRHEEYKIIVTIINKLNEKGFTKEAIKEFLTVKLGTTDHRLRDIIKYDLKYNKDKRVSSTDPDTFIYNDFDKDISNYLERFKHNKPPNDNPKLLKAFDEMFCKTKN